MARSGTFRPNCGPSGSMTSNRTAIARARHRRRRCGGSPCRCRSSSLGWLDPAWLTVARFALAAPLLALVGRRGLRGALVPRVAAGGAVGFGAVVVLQNLGIERTSVSHAALVVGAVPVLVALIAAASDAGTTRPLAWSGLRRGARRRRPRGRCRRRRLDGRRRRARARLGGAVGRLHRRCSRGSSRGATSPRSRPCSSPRARCSPCRSRSRRQGRRRAPAAAHAAGVVAALALTGTLLPFWLFAYAQARVPAELAGAFVNLEPVVGAAAGWLVMGESAAAGQLAGAVAVLAGIAISTLPARRGAVTAGDAPPRSGRAGGARRGSGRRTARPHPRRGTPRRGRTTARARSRGRTARSRNRELRSALMTRSRPRRARR